MNSERHQESALLIRHSLDVALQNGFWPAAFRAFNNLGVEYYFTDRLRDGLALFSAAEEHARRLGDRNEVVRALTSELGYMQWLGLWDEGLAVSQQCLEMASGELLQSSWLINRFASTVFILCERGELEEARRLVERFAPWLESDQPDVAVANVGMAATILHADGRHADALRVLREAWSGARLHVTHPSGKLVWPLAMESALMVPDLEAAENLLAPVLSRRPGQTPPSLAGLRVRYRARIAAMRGESAGLEEAWESAIAIFRGAEMAFHQAVAQLELAEWLVSQGKEASSVVPLAEARAIFERLKARPWLERLDRLGAEKVSASAAASRGELSPPARGRAG